MSSSSLIFNTGFEWISFIHLYACFLATSNEGLDNSIVHYSLIDIKKQIALSSWRNGSDGLFYIF